MSIPASRWWHLRWREHLSDQEFARDPRLWLLVDHIALTTSGEHPDTEGSTVSQATLAEVTGWQPKTVRAKLGDLERRGLLLIKHGDVQIGQRGRPGNRYLLPPFLATWSKVRGNDERAMTPKPSRDNGSPHAHDDPQTPPIYGSSGGIYGSSGPVYGSSHAHDDPGRDLKGLEGGDARGGAREDTPPPPAFPDQCRQHQDDYNDAPCRGCQRRRESNEAAAQAAAANDPVQQLTQRYFDFLEKRHRRDPNMPPPNWDRCLDWAAKLVEHPWCGQCDEFQRTVRNEYGGPEACQCRPGRRHGVAS